MEEENSRGPQPGGTIPVTMDISGMYTNIPWQEGTDAFKEAMEQRVCKAVPTVFLITLLHLVLSSNLFTFDGALFLQLFGVAIGTWVAPTFDCFFSWAGLRRRCCRTGEVILLVYGDAT